MRILTVAGWISPDLEGGSFRVVFELARGLVARGHEVNVLTQALPGHEQPQQVIDGVQVHRYRTWARSGVSFYVSSVAAVRRLMGRLVAAQPFDALHLHHPVSALGATLCPSSRDMPTLHTFYVPYFLEHAFNRNAPPGRPGPVGRALRCIDHHNLRRSDAIVVLSQFTAGQVAEHFPDCSPRVEIIPAGVDLQVFRPTLSRAEARRQLNLPTDAPILLSVRRLEPRMGLENLVEAMPLLRNHRPNAKLVIVGRGSLQHRLTDLVGRLNLADAVTMAGFVPDAMLPVYYQAADCFVVPTIALEGFGMVTAEALACGTPVLGTPVGATPELLRPLDEHLVMRSTEPADIAQGIAQFLERPDLAEWRERCRRYAEQRFDWRHVVERYEAVFERIIAARHESGRARLLPRP